MRDDVPDLARIAPRYFRKFEKRHRKKSNSCIGFGEKVGASGVGANAGDNREGRMIGLAVSIAILW